MFDAPLVTIVTPSLNQVAFLEETIQSVIQQDYPHIEYIIVDGGSTDGSVDIIRTHQQHLKYWVSEPDKGQSNAINKGFAQATGAIFSWLNSDDLLAPSAVRIATHFLSVYPEIGLAYGDRLHIDAKRNVVGVLRCPSHDNGMFKKNITLPQESTFFRRNVFDSVGGLDEDLHFSMDFDLWCKIARVSRMRHIPTFMGYFREHGVAKSVTFHDVSKDAHNSFRVEHQRVFQRHFGKKVPSALMMQWYRLGRQFRLLLEQKSNSYRQAKRNIRRLTATELIG
jgi:glycosyltransferase involved in cell wall biosynthesis